MKRIEFPFSIPLFRGIDGDNGATPWYTKLKLGANKQELNFAFDSGTPYSWVTSARCTTDACLMHQRFAVNNSPSFIQISDPFNPYGISFGPWGSMLVSLGSDSLAFEDAEAGTYFCAENYAFYLSHLYNGSQFSNLVWDGAVGIPSTLEGATTSELISQILKKIIANTKILNLTTVKAKYK